MGVGYDVYFSFPLEPNPNPGTSSSTSGNKYFNIMDRYFHNRNQFFHIKGQELLHLNNYFNQQSFCSNLIPEVL